jgi:hypothetical protein
MLDEVAREEQLAAARALPRHASVELPAAEAEPLARAGVAPAAAAATRPTQGEEATTFVPAPKELMNVGVEPAAARSAAREAVRDDEHDAPLRAPVSNPAPAQTPKPAPGRAANPEPTPGRAPGGSLFSFDRAAPSEGAHEASPGVEAPGVASVAAVTERPPAARAAAPATSAASLRLTAEPSPLRVGERRRLTVLLKTDAPLGLVALTFRLDPRALAVRSVAAGSLFGPSGARLTHSTTAEGLLLVTVAPDRPASPLSGAGVLLSFDVEALASGAEPLRFDADDVHLVATDGRKVLVKVLADRLSVSE